MNKLSVYISIIRRGSIEDCENLTIAKAERKVSPRSLNLYETHNLIDYYFNNGVIIQYKYYKYNPVGGYDEKIFMCTYKVIESSGLDFDRRTEYLF